MTDASGPSQSAISRAVSLAFATNILMQTERRALSLAAVHAWLWPAVQLEQIRFLPGPDGVPIAYMTWGFLNSRSASRLTSMDGSIFDIADWNDGLELWIVDVVAPQGGARELLRRFEADMSGRWGVVHWFRDRSSLSAGVRTARFRSRS